MKDDFFVMLNKIWNYIYHFVTKLTYAYIVSRKCRKSPKLDKDNKQYIKSYWKTNYGKHISLIEFKWYKNFFPEKIDPRLIPDVIWHSEIEPYFTNMQMLLGFSDKNYFELIIGKSFTPKTIIHCINKQLLDCNYSPISISNGISLLKNYQEIICKPSIDTGGGRGVLFLKQEQISNTTINNLIKNFKGNFLVQEIIHQCEFLSKFNPYSVNTIRILSFLSEGKTYVLSAFLRFGNENNRLDNVSTGGGYIPIDKEGYLKPYVIKEKLTNHNLIKEKTSAINGFNFAKQRIPSWERTIELITVLHYKLSHFKIINWDISIQCDGTPIVIEYNLIDSSVSFHQISSGPIFGDMTENILSKIKSTRER